MRRCDLDWARNLIVYTLVLYHSARVFDSFDPFYVKAPVSLAAADGVILALGSWSMPLLFAVAGAASWFALTRRTAARYASERITRLLVPFVVGVAVIVPPQSYLAARAAGYRGGYLGYWFGPFFTEWGDPSGYEGGFTIAHLWFLLVLVAISLPLAPALTRWRRAGAAAASSRTIGGLRRPALYLACCVPLTLLELVPEVGGKNLAICAAFFLIGFAALPAESFTRWARRRRWLLLAAGAGLEAVTWWAEFSWGFPSGVSAASFVTAVAHQLATLLLIAGVIGAGTSPRLPGRALPWLNRACLPYYVVHQSVVVLLAAWVLTWPLPAGLAFPALVALSGAVSFALAAGIVAIRPLGVLFGVKPLPAAAADKSPAQPRRLSQ